MPTSDETTPNTYQITQPAQGERPAESQPIRDNWETLQKLLDGSTMADGHHHDLRTLGAVVSLLYQNLLRNGSFEIADGAGTTLFEDWTADANSTLTQETGAGNFSHRDAAAQLVEDGTNGGWLRQSVGDGSQPITDLLAYLEGQTVTFRARVKTSTASAVRIEIEDDDGTPETQSSSDHSGGGSFEVLTVSKTLRSGLNDLILRIEADAASSATVYIDEAALYIGGDESNPPSLGFVEHPTDFGYTPVANEQLATKAYADSAGGGSGSKPFSVFVAEDNQPPAQTIAATPDTRNRRSVLDFDDSTDERAHFPDVLSPDYAGGGLTVEIWWVAASTTGDVVWAAAIERLAAGGQDLDSDSFAADNTATSTVAGNAGVQTKTTITFTDGADMDSLAAGEPFRLRIERLTSDAGDTMTGDAEVTRVVVRET